MLKSRPPVATAIMTGALTSVGAARQQQDLDHDVDRDHTRVAPFASAARISVRW